MRVFSVFNNLDVGFQVNLEFDSLRIVETETWREEASFREVHSGGLCGQSFRCLFVCTIAKKSASFPCSGKEPPEQWTLGDDGSAQDASRFRDSRFRPTDCLL
ncbi:hypothetical protein CEXT_300311 [Caerostris extrusa]|uniref:Uncharacterized protein n=1 Tax=Caerostris extrusa TaxID=172846 RepID=A0AAV4V718_CAEEX|nr:hypothetical protein CEXT_300311 [Caerostris extrusa]